MSIIWWVEFQLMENALTREKEKVYSLFLFLCPPPCGAVILVK